MTFQACNEGKRRRLFPNFFQDAPFNIKYYKPGRPETEIAYMGCRTRVIGNIHDPKRKYHSRKPSFTSINLPRIAIKANGSVEWFFEELDRKIDLCIDQLKRGLKYRRLKVRNYHSLWVKAFGLTVRKVDDEIREVLKQQPYSWLYRSCRGVKGPYRSAPWRE